MTLRELGEKAREMYKGELAQLKKREEWIQKRIGTGGGLNETYIGHWDGNKFEYSEPEKHDVGKFVVDLEDKMRTIAGNGTIGGCPRDPRSVALDPLYRAIEHRTMTQEVYNAIVIGEHPDVKRAVAFIEECGFRPPECASKPVEGDQRDPSVINQFERSRPSFLFPDAEDYRMEMRMLRRGLLEKYGEQAVLVAWVGTKTREK